MGELRTFLALVLLETVRFCVPWWLETPVMLPCSCIRTLNKAPYTLNVQNWSTIGYPLVRSGISTYSCLDPTQYARPQQAYQTKGQLILGKVLVFTPSILFCWPACARRASDSSLILTNPDPTCWALSPGVEPELWQRQGILRGLMRAFYHLLAYERVQIPYLRNWVGPQNHGRYGL